ncbi:unnamed protein product [Spirodela intermedia]|uniref:Uncharacterized protein n=1 Tax=Spirodela intermedia TaxID=51605 RepID=A0A7I8JSK3_SPIIN|nr:unnamed protein product [Spirodela intermedia]CAA6673170.1 unnamed protein product [Spirodela intermedia]
MAEVLVLKGVLKGHTDVVTAIATPIDNSDMIVSSSRDKSVLVWHLTKDSALSAEGGASTNYGVPDVVLSSDGQFALSGSWDGDLRLWDLNTGATTRRFVGHTKDVLSVAFSVDNRQIVSASRDRTIKLWNTLGECKYTIQDGESHTNWVSCVRFSPNTFVPTIVSGSWDRTVKVWNLSNCKLRYTLTGHGGYVNTVAVSPTGLFARAAARTVSRSSGTWQRGNGCTRLTPVHHPLPMLQPNRYWLCAATQDSIKIWDLESKVIVQDLKPEVTTGKNQLLYCTSLSWSSDGSTLFTGYTDGVIRVWGISRAY